MTDKYLQELDAARAAWREMEIADEDARARLAKWQELADGVGSALHDIADALIPEGSKTERFRVGQLDSIFGNLRGFELQLRNEPTGVTVIDGRAREHYLRVTPAALVLLPQLNGQISVVYRPESLPEREREERALVPALDPERCADKAMLAKLVREFFEAAAKERWSVLPPAE